MFIVIVDLKYSIYEKVRLDGRIPLTAIYLFVSLTVIQKRNKFGLSCTKIKGEGSLIADET